jgi:hypothetical protein
MPKRGMKDCCKMHRMKAAGMLVLGALVLINWYWGLLNWSVFIGGLLVLGGLLKLAMPHHHY